MSTMSRDICLRCRDTSHSGGGGIRTLETPFDVCRFSRSGLRRGKALVQAVCRFRATGCATVNGSSSLVIGGRAASIHVHPPRVPDRKRLNVAQDEGSSHIPCWPCALPVRGLCFVAPVAFGGRERHLGSGARTLVCSELRRGDRPRSRNRRDQLLLLGGLWRSQGQSLGLHPGHRAAFGSHMALCSGEPHLETGPRGPATPLR